MVNDPLQTKMGVSGFIQLSRPAQESKSLDQRTAHEFDPWSV
jgi:hypothetical protein